MLFSLLLTLYYTRGQSIQRSIFTFFERRSVAALLPHRLQGLVIRLRIGLIDIFASNLKGSVGVIAQLLGGLAFLSILPLLQFLCLTKTRGVFKSVAILFDYIYKTLHSVCASFSLPTILVDTRLSHNQVLQNTDQTLGRHSQTFLLNTLVVSNIYVLWSF